MFKFNKVKPFIIDNFLRYKEDIKVTNLDHLFNFKFKKKSDYEIWLLNQNVLTFVNRAKNKFFLTKLISNATT